MTYYHTLIALVKATLSGETYDLLLANDIPSYQELMVRLRNTNRFQSIYELDVIEIRKRKFYKNKLDKILYQKKRNKKAIARCLPLDFRYYSDLYIFQDVSEIGEYLIQEKIKYHLLEDALDYFKYFHQYYNLAENVYLPGTIRFWLKGILSFQCWGMSASAIDIEVNDMTDIKIPKEKVIEVPRRKLFDNLSQEDKKLIFDAYVGDKKMEKECGKSMILFTQPLFADHFVETMKEQELIFENIVKEYCNSGYVVTIKPHPRDLGDYLEISSNFHCKIIDKNIPSEILDFDSDRYYDIAIAITSTSINFLNHVKERRWMGRGFIEQCLTRYN